jgi:hypothetical protein
LATMRTVPPFQHPPDAPIPRLPGSQAPRAPAVGEARQSQTQVNGWLNQKSSPSSRLPRALPLTSFFPNLLTPSRSSVKHLLGSAGAVVIFGGSPPFNGRVFSLFFCGFPPAPSCPPRRRQYTSVLFVAVSSSAPHNSKRSHGLSLHSRAFCTSTFSSCASSSTPSIGRQHCRLFSGPAPPSHSQRHSGPDPGPRCRRTHQFSSLVSFALLLRSCDQKSWVALSSGSC